MAAATAGSGAPRLACSDWESRASALFPAARSPMRGWWASAASTSASVNGSAARPAVWRRISVLSKGLEPTISSIHRSMSRQGRRAAAASARPAALKSSNSMCQILCVNAGIHGVGLYGQNIRIVELLFQHMQKIEPYPSELCQPGTAPRQPRSARQEPQQNLVDLRG